MAGRRSRRPPRASLVRRWLGLSAIVIVAYLYYHPLRTYFETRSQLGSRRAEVAQLAAQERELQRRVERIPGNARVCLSAALGAPVRSQLDEHCRANEGAVFAALATQRQDALLHALEKGELKVPEVHGKAFFKMLWQNTQEGYFADPMYGGNREFAGWRLVGYTGPRYNYIEPMRHFGQPYDEPPVGILGRDWRRRQPGMT